MAGMPDTLTRIGDWRQRRQGVAQSCRQDIARDRKTAHEVGMRPPRAILRLTVRLAQVPRRERRVEIVKERSVVQHCTSSAPLRVAGYLAPTEDEIGSGGN